MTLEERIASLEQQLQRSLANERQAFEVRLRTEGALIAMRQLLEEHQKEANDQKDTPDS